MSSIGKPLILIGAIILITGLLITILNGLKLPLGQLPGDFRFRVGNLTCFVPLTSALLLSILLSIVINIILRYFNR